jgi:hypothetical protein
MEMVKVSSVNNNLKQQKMDKETVNQQIINGLKSKGIFIGSISPDVLETFANIMYKAINYTHCCKTDSERLKIPKTTKEQRIQLK